MEDTINFSVSNLFFRITKGIIQTSKLYIPIMSIVMLINSLIPAASLLIMQQIINYIQTGNDDIISIVKLVIIYVSIDLFAIIINSFMSFFTSKFSLKYNLKIEKLILDKTSNLSLCHYENSKTYDMIKLAEATNGLMLLNQFNLFFSIIGMCVTAFSYIIILIEFNYWLILLIIFLPLIKYFIMQKINIRHFNIIKERTTEARKASYYRHIVTTGTSYKELKSFNLFSFFIDKYEHLIKQFNKQDIKINSETLVKVTVVSIIEQVIIGAIFTYIIFCGFIGKILLGDVVAFTKAIVSNQSSIQQILQTITSIKKNHLSISQFYSFIDLDITEVNDKGKLIKIDKINEIRTENLSFKYSTGDYVLKNINIALKENDVIAIVGKNGSGKTTLAKLLLGFYSNYEGNIYINNVELRTIDKEHYMRKTAILFQDFTKYEATYRENIAYGNLSIMNEDNLILKYGEMFKLSSVIDKSENPLDTQLGFWFNNGKQLSFGEWQKLALARTFSKDSDVIFLDEPNSALDSISDYNLSCLYKKLLERKMGVIIAHKFNNFTQQSTCILVLENGSLVQHGKHDALIKEEGLYNEMYNLQIKN